MSGIYELERSSSEWIEGVRKAAHAFAPGARLHLHLVQDAAAENIEVLLDRMTDDAVARMASADVLEQLEHPDRWNEHPELETGRIAVDIELGDARAVALVEDADELSETDLNSVELFLHHWEASFFLRQLFERFPQAESALNGMRLLMRSLREEAEYLRLREDCTQIWEGVVDGTWTLVRLDRNQSRWQFVLKANPPGFEDPRALSPRESQVVRRAARGESNKIIAHALDLEESTVGSYLQRALAKLQINNRVELVSMTNAIVAYQNRMQRTTDGLREESVGVLDALDRLDDPESQVIVNHLRELVTRLK